MAERFGLLQLPAPAVPQATRPIQDRTAGDPCLDVLLQFFAAVLNTDLGPLWASLDPARPNEPARRPVEFVWGYDPLDYDQFTTRELPALFLYRCEGPAPETRDDILRAIEELTLRWVLPKAQPTKAALRNTIANAATKALTRALRMTRHPAWVVEQDLADPDAVLLARATQTMPVVLEAASFDGAVGAGIVHAARPVRLSTAAAAGAYNTTDPYGFEGVLEDGRPHTEWLRLTDPNGGEIVNGIWNLSRITRIHVPGHPGAGFHSVGFDDSPEVDLGSIVWRAAGLERAWLLGPGKTKKLSIPVKGAASGKDDYDMVEFSIRIVEVYDLDAPTAYDELADGPPSSPNGLSELRYPDGSTYETFSLE